MLLALNPHEVHVIGPSQKLKTEPAYMKLNQVTFGILLANFSKLHPITDFFFMYKGMLRFTSANIPFSFEVAAF